MRTLNTKKSIKINMAVFSILSIALLMGINYYAKLNTPLDRNGVLQLFIINKGASFKVIANNLEDNGLIKSARAFSTAASLKKAYKSVQAGEYELSPAMSPMEILNIFISGKVKLHKLTVPEGRNIYDIANSLEELGLVSKEDFLGAVRDKKLIKKIGIKGNSFEGYLFPDTYLLSRVMNAEDIISVMVRNFKNKFKKGTGLEVEFNFDFHNLITMASIIEKETAVTEEMPIIASVFYNRLEKGYRLQTDPTVIYPLLPDFDGNLTRRDLKRKNKYNTYTMHGLPIGPIANPGMLAIKAALNPSDSKYLYFVSMNNGTHKFSKTLKEHNEAVYYYQTNRATRLKSMGQ